MTVEELIKQLKQCPKDTVVQYCKGASYETVTIVEYNNNCDRVELD